MILFVKWINYFLRLDLLLDLRLDLRLDFLRIDLFPPDVLDGLDGICIGRFLLISAGGNILPVPEIDGGGGVDSLLLRCLGGGGGGESLIYLTIYFNMKIFF